MNYLVFLKLRLAVCNCKSIRYSSDLSTPLEHPQFAHNKMGTEEDFDPNDKEAFISSVNNTLNDLLREFKTGAVIPRYG